MKTRITIRGQTYTVRSDDDDVDLQEVAAYVDRKMTEIASKSARLDPYTVALLSALNIAQDFARHRRDVDQLLARTERDIEAAEAMLGGSGTPEATSPSHE